MADVVAFRQGVCPQAPPEPPVTITIPLVASSLHSVLYHLKVATELALLCVAQIDDNPVMAVRGVRQVLEAFSSLASSI